MPDAKLPDRIERMAAARLERKQMKQDGACRDILRIPGCGKVRRAAFSSNPTGEP
jgi:hypothetical protein